MGSKIALLLALIILFIFFRHAQAGVKVFLLLSEEFPQIPIKPLHFLTNEPQHEVVYFGDGIAADLFLPNHLTPRPALIIAMGVRTNEKDKPTLLGFADTLSRLGYVVMWPRLQALEAEQVKFENPKTFIQAFHYLEKRKEVNKNSISFAGFSVGSSLAMVAGEDFSINKKLHSLIFFGGYFNILDYFYSLATQTMTVDAQKIPWQPHEDGLNHAKGILEKEGLSLERFRDEKLDDRSVQKLLRFSPDQEIDRYKAPIFILHEKADSFVPYVESIKLKDTLSGRVPLEFHLASVFEHVQPGGQALNFQFLQELVGLFGFLHKMFMYL